MCQQGRQRFVVRSLIHSPREKVLHLFRFMWKTFISLVRFILPLSFAVLVTREAPCSEKVITTAKMSLLELSHGTFVNGKVN
jgi:hypothetical protein